MVCAVAFILTLWPILGTDQDFTTDSTGFHITNIVRTRPECEASRFAFSEDGRSIILYRMNKAHYQRVIIPLPRQGKYGSFHIYYEWGKPEGKIDGFPFTAQFWESPYMLSSLEKKKIKKLSFRVDFTIIKYYIIL